MHREVLVGSFLSLCPRVDGLCLVIISYLEKAEIIINTIRKFWTWIFVAFGIVARSANCSPKLVAKYLAV
jgi:hypothetical protein